MAFPMCSLQPQFKLSVQPRRILVTNLHKRSHFCPKSNTQFKIPEYSPKKRLGFVSPVKSASVNGDPLEDYPEERSVEDGGADLPGRSWWRLFFSAFAALVVTAAKRMRDKLCSTLQDISSSAFGDLASMLGVDFKEIAHELANDNLRMFQAIVAVAVLLCELCWVFDPVRSTLMAIIGSVIILVVELVMYFKQRKNPSNEDAQETLPKKN